MGLDLDSVGVVGGWVCSFVLWFFDAGGGGAVCDYLCV